VRARLKTEWFCAGVMLASVTMGLVAEPRIDYIEILNSTYVNIHFDTAPNRTYTLQYRTSLNSTNPNVWTNFFTAPSYPFQNHYVISDFRTNGPRYYRLKVTP
jgi:hypothetical protein